MKFNKLFLRLAHFFGFYKGTEHIDDITVHIPTVYTMSLGDIGYQSDKEKELIIVNDIKSQIINKFETDSKLENRCAKVGQVYVCVPSTEMRNVAYLDGTLYWRSIDREALKRAFKMKEILN